METDNVVEVNNQRMKKLELTWNNYIDYLIEAIDESKFMKRAEIKPMATPKDDLESHVTSRATHVRNAANIAKRIAKGLDLNDKFAYAAMLMHDAGHPFSAHDGEVIFTDIGELYNCQYFHHNAKGVDVILSEDIFEKAIAKIPNIKNQPELRKKLKDEFYYFLDVVISHDGEASPDEMYRRETEYPDLKTAVETKLESANAMNRYKFIAQTTEGKIAKFADVLAYLPTDMQDGFRLGIYKDFPEEYLELFGEMFAEDFVKTREEKITIAKSIINKIKDDKLRELLEDAKNEENREVINVANKIASDIIRKNIDFENDEETTNAVIEEHISQYRAKYYKNATDEEKQYLYSEIERIKEFAGKKLRVRSSVVSEVTTRMQEFFINDLLKTSAIEGELRFSKPAEKLFFRAKGLNYTTYVPYTKWEYQKEKQPSAAHRLVKLCARCLIKTGAIRDKFYDRTIRNLITDPEALKYMRVHLNEGQTIEEAQVGYERAKRAYEIRDFRTATKRYTGGNSGRAKYKRELSSNVYEFTQNEGESFARKYMNTYKAIPTQIKVKVDKALSGTYKEKNLFNSDITQEINEIRKKMLQEYGTLEITTEQKQGFISKLVNEERNKMEEKMAVQIAIDYISGMTDRGFNELAIQIGFMEQSDLFQKSRVTPKEAKNDENLARLAEKMRQQPNEDEGR